MGQKRIPVILALFPEVITQPKEDVAYNGWHPQNEKLHLWLSPINNMKSSLHRIYAGMTSYKEEEE